mgnify:CR=1 FL=1
MSYTLHHYFRSSCSWRVRIALAWKGLPFEVVPVHLLRDEQHAATHRRLNPSEQVPVLIVDGTTALAQSLAILEYLEEVHPAPALLPSLPVQRARARQMAEVVNSGIQPLQNLQVLQSLERDFGLSADQARSFARSAISRGLVALEALLREHSGTCALGDSVSIADLCLVPQLYNARRFDVDLTAMPTAVRVERHLLGLPAFAATHPDRETVPV